MEIADQTTTVSAPAADTPSLIIFGLDDQKKPHASAFIASEADLAQKAAALMGMTVFTPKNEEERALVGQLPRGKLFASGRAFVPFVAGSVYKRLCEFAGVAATVPPETKDTECTAPSSPNDSVVASADTVRGETVRDNETELFPGAIILAADEAAFYEAAVVKIDGDVLSLRWIGYKLPIFQRRRWQVTPLPDRKPYW